MVTYQYKALRKADNSLIQGTISAQDERQAREFLREQELYPTSVKLLLKPQPSEPKKQEKTQSSFEMWLAEKLCTMGIKEKLAFTQNLEMMVKAGIPITEALLYMESYMDNIKFKKLLSSIRLDILAGSTLSRSLSKHDKFFNDIYISIVQAGEASGELETVLKRLSDLLLAESKLRKKIILALVYPIILVVIITIVMAIMFVFVIPTFADIYVKLGVQLPLITRVMIGISDFLRNFWYIALPAIVGAVLGFYKFACSDVGKRLIDKILLKIPVVSPLLTAVCSSHFLSTLHISFSSGLPITDCIFMACQTVTNTAIRTAFDEVNLKIQAGQRLAAALAEANYLPAMTLIMISTGEESGSLEEMLSRCLDYLDQEVNQRVEILMSMMEPFMIVVLGIIVGCLALAIYLPMFGVYEHIG